MRIGRVRFLDDRPISYEEVVLPLSRFPLIGRNGEIATDIFELARQHGLTLGIARERASTVQARRDVAAYLRVSEGTRLLKLDRIVSTADGTPIEWRVSFSVSSE